MQAGAAVASLGGVGIEASNSTALQGHQLPTAQEGGPQGQGSDVGQSSARTTAAVAASLVGLAATITATVLLVAHQRKKKQQRLQRLRLLHLMQSKDLATPNLATAALIRGSSSASTESNGSQTGLFLFQALNTVIQMFFKSGSGTIGNVSMPA